MESFSFKLEHLFHLEAWLLKSSSILSISIMAQLFIEIFRCAFTFYPLSIHMKCKAKFICDMRPIPFGSYESKCIVVISFDQAGWID